MDRPKYQQNDKVYFNDIKLIIIKYIEHCKNRNDFKYQAFSLKTLEKVVVYEKDLTQ
tara:strand:+ start:52 stop:222 length:171 start_codon:yes stop_codon:yes gene_type:complete